MRSSASCTSWSRLTKNAAADAVTTPKECDADEQERHGDEGDEAAKASRGVAVAVADRGDSGGRPAQGVRERRGLASSEFRSTPTMAAAETPMTTRTEAATQALTRASSEWRACR